MDNGTEGPAMYWESMHSHVQQNTKADIWVKTSEYGYRVENCIFTKPFGKEGRSVWINMNGAPIENDLRKVTHFMVVRGPN